MTADEIKAVVIRRYLKKRFCIYTEVGLCKRGRLRADLVALSMRPFITIVEVKSSPRDFRTDKKMLKYWQFCNQLFVACTKDTYDKIKDEIDPSVGVMVVSGKSVKVVKKCRVREVAPDITLNIAVRMAYRNAEFNRYKR